MRISIVLLMLAALPACGQKGPLYLPTPKPVAGLPAATPAPSAGARVDDRKDPAADSTKGP